MTPKQVETESYRSELRLIIEEFCGDLVRHTHIAQDKVHPQDVDIARGVDIGYPDAFANVRVQIPGKAPYFIEVKHGYSTEQLVQMMRRKFGRATPETQAADRVLLVVDCGSRDDWSSIEARIRKELRPGLALEVWDENRLLSELREKFQIDVRDLKHETLLDIREAIDRAKGFAAFGGASLAEYEDTPLKASMVWHFGSWRLRQLRERGRKTPREILPPGLYRDVVVVMADLSGFSAFVRDTRDDAVIRHSLTSFYSMSRTQVITNGGMFYQFAGDQIIGLFGVPEPEPAMVPNALKAAVSLLSVGATVTSQWQRHIDRVQSSHGLHVGIAVGDLQIVALRPFSRVHMGAVGDPINVAARLVAKAGPGELVVSNSFYNELEEDGQLAFTEIEAIEARNVGRIKAWKRSSKY